MCGAEIPEGHTQQFLRHVKACAGKHREDLEAAVEMREAKAQETYFTSPLDPEFEVHVRKGGN